ncbi:unnamed protein product [Gongylonema pulchrum]|uniref:C-type lectin domain-containing protein n=1 Tax=Gongylonema pulchrum TaxID=637853 RepID=A0A183EE26_9BILA|nr:unnamed protein product [Gongylonema pulchrum]
MTTPGNVSGEYWTDGTPVDFTAWSTPPSERNFTDSCGVTYPSSNDVWKYVSCDQATIKAVACRIPLYVCE